MEHVVPHMRACLASNGAAEVQVIASRWGAQMVEQVQLGQPSLFDLVIMADVLYHVEDFTDLLSSILGVVKVGGDVVVTYEQRRRNVDEFFERLAVHFQACRILKYSIEKELNAEQGEGEGEELGSGRGGHVVFYLYKFSSRKGD